MAEGVCRLAGLQPAHFDEEQTVLTVQPDSFLVNDHILGFRLGKGAFKTYLNRQLLFEHHINRTGDRITSINELDNTPNPILDQA